jgi:hypothetical protein
MGDDEWLIERNEMIICGLGGQWGRLDLEDWWYKVELGKVVGR